MHLRFMNNGTKEASRYNFNAKGIELLNKEILEPYRTSKTRVINGGNERHYQVGNVYQTLIK